VIELIQRSYILKQLRHCNEGEKKQYNCDVKHEHKITAHALRNLKLIGVLYGMILHQDQCQALK